MLVLIHQFHFIIISCIFSGYIEEFEIVDDHRQGKVVVFLNGRINQVFL